MSLERRIKETGLFYSRPLNGYGTGYTIRYKRFELLYAGDFHIWCRLRKETGRIRWYISTPGSLRELTFEEMLEQLPKEIQTKFLFHIDIFL